MEMGNFNTLLIGVKNDSHIRRKFFCIYYDQKEHVP